MNRIGKKECLAGKVLTSNLLRKQQNYYFRYCSITQHLHHGLVSL